MPLPMDEYNEALQTLRSTSESQGKDEYITEAGDTIQAALDELEALREQVRQARAELDNAVSVRGRQHLYNHIDAARALLANTVAAKIPE